eukprot:Pgem_evm1s185
MMYTTTTLPTSSFSSNTPTAPMTIGKLRLLPGRQAHNQAEKERRIQLQQCYTKLQEAVIDPDSKDIKKRGDASRIRIIKAASECIDQLHKQHEILTAQKNFELQKLINLQLRLMEVQANIFK